MIIPDANLLIYAYDELCIEHQTSKQWWEETLSGSETVGIPWVVILAFTRIMTHPQVTNDPISSREVQEIVMEWIQQPVVRIIHPGENSLHTFFDLLEEAGMGGNLSTDALIAAHAREHSARIASNDRDLQRFSGVRCFNPLRPQLK
jgi:toxin-antitoxin system PIN domain toxin